MAKSIVSLEITEESVRAAEVAMGRVPTLIAAGEVPLPPGAAKDSEILDAEAVAVALRQLWTRAGIKGRRVVLGIGSRRILVREYTTQAMRPDLLKQALGFQVQDLLPVPVNQAVLDFYPISQVDGQISGLLVAAVSETIEELLKTLSKVKLTVDRVDLVPFGLARIAHRLAGPTDTVAMVHIGDHTSYVVIAVGGVPRFVRIIPVDVSTAAVRAREPLALPVDALESAMETVPPQPPRGRAALRNGNADPALADLVSRLRSTVAFYANRPDAMAVQTIFLSGAGAATLALGDALENALDIPVERIGATNVARTKWADAPLDDFQLNLVSTIGLAIEEAY